MQATSMMRPCIIDRCQTANTGKDIFSKCRLWFWNGEAGRTPRNFLEQGRNSVHVEKKQQICGEGTLLYLEAHKLFVRACAGGVLVRLRMRLVSASEYRSCLRPALVLMYVAVLPTFLQPRVRLPLGDLLGS